MEKNISMKKAILKPSIFMIMVVLIGVWQACENDEATVAPPEIKSFTPEAGGPVNTVVKLKGRYFSLAGTNTVTFNNVEAKVITSKTTVS
jgi:hypothetical protein